MMRLVAHNGGVAESRQTGPRTVQQIREEFDRLVAGHETIKRDVMAFLSVWMAGMSSPDRPAGVFLLAGPSGTGKTHLVLSLATALHGDRRLIRIDCGEYTLDHEVSRLIGSPPGYVGHRETMPALSPERLMTARSDRTNLALILFDEIEKASPRFSDLVLSVIGEARLTLGDNRTVVFNDTMVFMTSNLGAAKMSPSSSVGFSRGSRKGYEQAGRLVMERHFRPEFLNRIDRIFWFSPLGREELRAIARAIVSEISVRIKADLTVSDKFIDSVIEASDTDRYGARDIRRNMERMLLQPVAELLLERKKVSRVHVTETGIEID